MKIKIEFNCNNATFDFPKHEISHVLDQAKEKLISSIDLDGINICEFILFDSNGNTIGNASINAK